LLGESQHQPLLIVFEDLHWIDAETQSLLDALVESIPTVRTLVAVNYRPEYQHPWGSKTYYRQLRIDALPPESKVPATWQAILAARIDRLAPEDKQLLQAASVIGKDVPWVLLVETAEQTEEQIRRGLSRLQAAELLYEARLFPAPEYTFKHALTHEV